MTTHHLTQNENLIVCRDVQKWYGDFHALKGISLSVKKGEVIVILGPSGSGKSTFIRCLNRLEEHQEGEIIIEGTTLNYDVRNIAEIRRGSGHGFPTVQPLPTPDCFGKRHPGADSRAQVDAGPCGGAGHALADAGGHPRNRQTNIRGSFPAGSSSA
jgi:ABC-type phosphate transport system ATPase subunit